MSPKEVIALRDPGDFSGLLFLPRSPDVSRDPKVAGGTRAASRLRRRTSCSSAISDFPEPFLGRAG